MPTVLSENPKDLITTRSITTRHKDESTLKIIADPDGKVILDTAVCDILLMKRWLKAISIQPSRHAHLFSVKIKLYRYNLSMWQAAICSQRFAPINNRAAILLQDAMLCGHKRPNVKDDFSGMPILLTLELISLGVNSFG